MKEAAIKIVVLWCDFCVKIWSPVVDKINRSYDVFLGR